MLQWQSVANRLSYQRWRRGALHDLAGKGGGFNLSYSNLAGLMLAYNSADMGGLVRQTRPGSEGAGKWGLWTDFLSSFGSLDSTVNVTGYDFSIFGFNAGADYRFVEDLVLGFATGFTATNASFKGSGGKANVNSIPLYLYGAYTPGAFYVQGTLGYTINLYSLDRNIAFSGVSRVATSSVDGNQLNVALETGYDARVAQFIVTPAVTLNYSQAWVGSFTESGAGSLNLRVSSQSADSVQTGVGLRLSRPFQSGQTLILPQLYAFYQHEFAGDSRGLDARLAQTGSTFLFQTDSPSRDFALLGAGLALGLRKNLTFQATYNAEVGRSGYTPHVVSAGLRYEF
jgi:outer membrane lipase/esterase